MRIFAGGRRRSPDFACALPGSGAGRYKRHGKEAKLSIGHYLS